MDNFKEIAEECLSGKLSGKFILLDLYHGTEYSLPSTSISRRKYLSGYDFSCEGIVPFIDNPAGLCTMRYNGISELGTYEVVDFISDKKEIKIEVPEGYEIDKENSTFEKIVFKKINDGYPKSWDEYCKLNEDQLVYYIDGDSEVGQCHLMRRKPESDKNTVPTKKLAKGILVLTQLLSLRHAWIHQWSVDNGLSEDWEPNWKDYNTKYCISINDDVPYMDCEHHLMRILSFPNKKLALDFLNTFEYLIEQAKDLI